MHRPLLDRKQDRGIYRKSHSRCYSLQESCRWRRATQRVGNSSSPLVKTKSISSRLQSAGAVPLAMQIQFMCYMNLVDDVWAAQWFSIDDCCPKFICLAMQIQFTWCPNVSVLLSKNLVLVLSEFQFIWCLNFSLYAVQIFSVLPLLFYCHLTNDLLPFIKCFNAPRLALTLCSLMFS